MLRARTAASILAHALDEEDARNLLGEILAAAGAASSTVWMEGRAPRAAAKAAAEADAKAATAPDEPPGGEGDAREPAPERSAPASPAPDQDARSMGQLFKDEPMLQKAIDLFDGEVLP